MANSSISVDSRNALRDARHQLARGNIKIAERILRQQTAGGTCDADAHHLLSVIADTQGNRAEAVHQAERALAIDSRRAEFHFAHGRALKGIGRLDEAVIAYRSALRVHPEFAEVLVSLGIVLRLQGRLEEAADAYRSALTLRPNFAEALSNLGNVLAERVSRAVAGQPTAEDLREAEHVQRQALALSPRNPNLLHNLGLLCKLTGRYDEAADHLNHALGIDGDRVDTCLLFGSVLVEESRLDLARQLYTRWLRDRPAHPTVMVQLASVLADMGAFDEAASWLDRAHAMNAHAPEGPEETHLRGRIVQRQFTSDLDGETALANYRSAIEARTDYFEGVCSYLLTLCYLEEDPKALLAEHRLRIQPFSNVPRVAARAARQGPRRVRVGYVSSDFKRHSVAYFLEGILASHDRSSFEIFAYKGNAVGDEVTERMRTLCDHWIECGTLSDVQLAERIRAADIDVLIDLSGLTSGARLGVFQRRPAKCQITYLGYPTSTGADCFDARITDAVIDPPGADPMSSEPLRRTRTTMFSYRPGPLPAVAASPFEAKGVVTFGSFNNLAKAGRHTLALWCAVLRAVPDSHLLLKAQSLQQHGNCELLRLHFAEQGIDPARVHVQPWIPEVLTHLSTYDEVDIGLDTFPFNGATTTCEALVMGVPTVTLRGRTHPSRMGASILGAVGLHECITDDDDGFVTRAATLARDAGWLAMTRSGLRERVFASPLMDQMSFTRDFEKLLISTLQSANSTDTRVRHSM